MSTNDKASTSAWSRAASLKGGGGTLVGITMSVSANELGRGSFFLRDSGSDYMPGHRQQSRKVCGDVLNTLDSQANGHRQKLTYFKIYVQKCITIHQTPHNLHQYNEKVSGWLDR